MSIILYYNPTCGNCARKAQRTSSLDWLNRVQVSAEDSSIGQVPPGEIVVLHNETQRVLTGIDATRMICLNIPAYWIYGIALSIPSIRRMFAKGNVRCDDDTCAIHVE